MNYVLLAQSPMEWPEAFAAAAFFIAAAWVATTMIKSHDD